MAVNVDQILTDLSNGLESGLSAKYTAALGNLGPGSLDAASDTIKTNILGSTSMAINFSSLVVTKVLLIQRLAELAADTSGSAPHVRDRVGSIST